MRRLVCLMHTPNSESPNTIARPTIGRYRAPTVPPIRAPLRRSAAVIEGNGIARHRDPKGESLRGRCVLCTACRRQRARHDTHMALLWSFNLVDRRHFLLRAIERSGTSLPMIRATADAGGDGELFARSEKTTTSSPGDFACPWFQS